MSIGPEQRLSPEERANLAAYIDGELTENEERVIATKLSLSRTARREVESLKKTWELLEYLPRPKASADFPERTLTSIRSLESNALSWDQAARDWMFQVGKVAVCLLVAAAGLAIGYASVRWGWPDPFDSPGPGSDPRRTPGGIPGSGLVRSPGRTGKLQEFWWSFQLRPHRVAPTPIDSGPAPHNRDHRRRRSPSPGRRRSIARGHVQA